MKSVTRAFFIVLCISICSCQPSLNLCQTGSAGWVSFRKQAAVVQNGCKMIQRSDPATHVRSVYVQRESDKEPMLLYTHERGIEATLGHQGKLVLINDYFATKACKVMVADINSGNNWRIDEKTREQHTRTAPKQWLLYHAIPKAIASSPDDKMVLIAMESGYAATSPEDADEFGETFQLWSYVVDSTDGTVLHVYRTNGVVPHDWWEIEGRV